LASTWSGSPTIAAPQPERLMPLAFAAPVRSGPEPG